MDNQTFIIASFLLCSLGGWYVVATKYLALKKMVKDNNQMPPHIPGMGPPPVSNIPFSIPEEFLETAEPALARDPEPNASRYEPPRQPTTAMSSAQPPISTEKRLICNQTCMLHLSGFAIISGIPFLNIIIPTLFWLWKKEQHPYFARQGREVINFQITFTIIQFLCLGGGVLFIRYMPEHAEKLFAFFKITRIVFASGMYLPFNIFTVVPFFWCCIVMIRGAVAAYHGVSYKYPGSQQFLFSNPPARPLQASPMPAPVQPPPAAPSPVNNRVSFG